MRVEYGKIDYAIDCEGVPVVFDVNKTVGLSNPNSERAVKLTRDLADGLISFVEGNIQAQGRFD